MHKGTLRDFLVSQDLLIREREHFLGEQLTSPAETSGKKDKVQLLGREIERGKGNWVWDFERKRGSWPSGTK